MASTCPSEFFWKVLSSKRPPPSGRRSVIHRFVALLTLSQKLQKLSRVPGGPLLESVGEPRDAVRWVQFSPTSRHLAILSPCFFRACDPLALLQTIDKARYPLSRYDLAKISRFPPLAHLAFCHRKSLQKDCRDVRANGTGSSLCGIFSSSKRLRLKCAVFCSSDMGRNGDGHSLAGLYATYVVSPLVCVWMIQKPHRYLSLSLCRRIWPDSSTPSAMIVKKEVPINAGIFLVYNVTLAIVSTHQVSPACLYSK